MGAYGGVDLQEQLRLPVKCTKGAVIQSGGRVS